MNVYCLQSEYLVYNDGHAHELDYDDLRDFISSIYRWKGGLELKGIYYNDDDGTVIMHGDIPIELRKSEFNGLHIVHHYNVMGRHRKAILSVHNAERIKNELLDKYKHCKIHGLENLLKYQINDDFSVLSAVYDAD